MTRKNAIANVDKWFSRFIRLKYSHNNWVFCYTCGTCCHVLDIDNGHFIQRAHHATRWHEDNCRPQCKRCNYHRHGEHFKFRERLLKDLGEDRLLRLEATGRQTVKFTVKELQEFSDHYRKKFNELTKTKGNPWKT